MNDTLLIHHPMVGINIEQKNLCEEILEIRAIKYMNADNVFFLQCAR